MYFEALDTVSGELERRFQQKNGLQVAAALEKLLLDAVNNALPDATSMPDELEKYYSKDIDLSHLKTEITMLPDLLSTYNQDNCKITKVTNVRTIAQILNAVSNSKS